MGYRLMASRFNPASPNLLARLWRLNWMLVVLLLLISGIGFAMLYSAAGGNWDPWASRQSIRMGVGFGLMIAVALVGVRIWMRVAYIVYAGALALLVTVEAFGAVRMGAQRWIDLKVILLQPSEVMKIALVLALARYFHSLNIEDIGRPHYLIVPLMLVAAPVALVMRQPDLGTALLLLIGGGAMFFLAGVRLWKFLVVFLGAVIAAPIAWPFLRSYQQDRVLTFLSPERDPLGAGYNLLQSKIALGSGGMFGRGYLQGTQSHLRFLPEKHTDFIFTMFAEEFGLFGGLTLIGLYVIVLLYGVAISMRSHNQFGRLVGMGVTATFFLYVFINIAMVMGVVPVVGVPLPLISYGGTAMVTLLCGFGLLMSVYVDRDVSLGRYGEPRNE
ncbi:MAG: rod shape-determining protein RodA [Rhodospirillaceae bacterium]|nr:rod shape-determining protein RodA [Rhodospirillaceae bacterium]